MLSKLLRRSEDRPRTPPGLRIYAVGDIHGEAELLLALLERLAGDLRAQATQRTLMVFLGDYVDRGPRSDLVIESLAALKARTPSKVRFICGNHDAMMLRFLTDQASGPAWARHGGAQTLAAYGVEAPGEDAPPDLWRQAQAALRAALPLRHVAFLEGLEASLTLGGYFFTHAGARPGVPLDEQSPDDLMWIRRDFLEDDRRFERVVVHGHTPADGPVADARRIGVDTGAYRTGVLTAVRLEGETQSFIQARRSGGEAFFSG